MQISGEKSVKLILVPANPDRGKFLTKFRIEETRKKAKSKVTKPPEDKDEISAEEDESLGEEMGEPHEFSLDFGQRTVESEGQEIDFNERTATESQEEEFNERMATENQEELKEENVKLIHYRLENYAIPGILKNGKETINENSTEKRKSSQRQDSVTFLG